MLYPTEEVFHPPHFCLSLSLALSTPAGLNESASQSMVQPSVLHGLLSMVYCAFILQYRLKVFLQSTLNIDEIDRSGLFTAICDGSQELFPFCIKYCSRSIIFIAVCIVEL